MIRLHFPYAFCLVVADRDVGFKGRIPFWSLVVPDFSHVLIFPSINKLSTFRPH